jgi:hypothetical protein
MSSGSGSLILTRLGRPELARDLPPPPTAAHTLIRRGLPRRGVSRFRKNRGAGGEPPTVALSGESDGAAQGGLAVLAAALHYAPALVRCAAAGGHPGPG